MRAPIELRVEYRRLNSFFSDYTKNISKGGTFIHTERPLPIGTEFVFHLVVPTLPEPLSLRGEVRWVLQPGDPAPGGEPAAPGMGIRFRYENDEERTRIEASVEDLMRLHLGPGLSSRLLRGGK